MLGCVVRPGIRIGKESAFTLGIVIGILPVMNGEQHEIIPLTDVQSHDRAMSLPIADVVRELVAMLGATTVAAITGVSETRAVNQWMHDRSPQKPHVLRFALQIANMISGVDHESVQAWFQGSNPRLDDAIPALMLRNRPLADVQAQLVAAARSFASRPENTPRKHKDSTTELRGSDDDPPSQFALERSPALE